MNNLKGSIHRMYPRHATSSSHTWWGSVFGSLISGTSEGIWRFFDTNPHKVFACTGVFGLLFGASVCYDNLGKLWGPQWCQCYLLLAWHPELGVHFLILQGNVDFILGRSEAATNKTSPLEKDRKRLPVTRWVIKGTWPSFGWTLNSCKHDWRKDECKENMLNFTCQFPARKECK